MFGDKLSPKRFEILFEDQERDDQRDEAERKRRKLSEEKQRAAVLDCLLYTSRCV